MYGITGRTGSHLPEALEKSSKLEFAGGNGSVFKIHSRLDQKVDVGNLAKELEKVKVIIDFSTIEANQFLLETIEKSTISQKAILIATTNLTKKQLATWRQLAAERSLKILQAPNTSLGILVMSKVCEQLAGVMDQGGFDADLIEWHHRHKKDSPGGTTKLLVDSILKGERISEEKKAKKIAHFVEGERPEDTIGVQVLRSGNVFGEHAVYFTSEDEQVSLTHRAFNRKLFARGATKLSEWLVHQQAGFYTLASVELSELVNA